MKSTCLKENIVQLLLEFEFSKLFMWATARSTDETFCRQTRGLRLKQAYTTCPPFITNVPQSSAQKEEDKF